jgi:hypothetical protein
MPSVPQYSAHMNVTRNLLGADEGVTRFVPYLGDLDDLEATTKKEAREIEKLIKAYNSNPPKSGQANERLYQIRSYIDRWLEEMSDTGIEIDDRQTLQSYLLTEDILDIKTKERKREIPKNASYPPETQNWCKWFSELFEEIFECRLKDVLVPKERQQELAEKVNIEYPSTSQSSADPNYERLGTYTSLTCLICSTANCLTHAERSEVHALVADDSSTDETEHATKTLIHEQLVMTLEDALRKQDMRLFAIAGLGKPFYSAEKPCSEECVHISDYSRSDRNHEITPEAQTTIRNMYVSARDNPDRSCNISFLLKLPCWRVYNEIGRMVPRSLKPPPPPGSIDWYDNKKKILKERWREKTIAHIHDERGQTSPVRQPLVILSGANCAWFSVLMMVLVVQKPTVLVTETMLSVKAFVPALITALVDGQVVLADHLG